MIHNIDLRTHLKQWGLCDGFGLFTHIFRISLLPQLYDCPNVWEVTEKDASMMCTKPQ